MDLCGIGGDDQPVEICGLTGSSDEAEPPLHIGLRHDSQRKLPALDGQIAHFLQKRGAIVMQRRLLVDLSKELLHLAHAVQHPDMLVP